MSREALSGHQAWSPSAPGSHLTSWIETIFGDREEAESALRADRPAFIIRRDIMKFVPEYIRACIISPGDIAQIKGFQELFIYLNQDASATLRQLVVAYFRNTPSLRGHLNSSICGSSLALESGIGDGNDLVDVKKLSGTASLNESIKCAARWFPNFDRLGAVHEAAHDSYKDSKLPLCFDGTRTRLLDEIDGWMNSGCGGQSIYILYGIAGIGKSTVARTLADRADRVGLLGASFFFARNEDNRKTARWLVPTIAYYLARHDEEFARCINESLGRDPDVSRRNIWRQHDVLIAKPLQSLMQSGSPILIVVDALDECDEDDAKNILSLFANSLPDMPRLKVFIAARPVLHIRTALNHYQGYKQFRMQDIEQSVVKADIQRYLNFRLSPGQVQEAFPAFRSPPWQLTEQQMELLVGISGKLFIIAATAVNFILDTKHAAPAKRAATLLDGVSVKDFSGSRHLTIMDAVYMRIIRAAQPDPADDWVLQFQKFVGAIVLLLDPLSCDALAKLLGVETDEISGALSNLHSLLAPNEKDHAFRVHHKSFSDFICDPDRCKMGSEFHIDRTMHHMQLAKHCLRVMNNELAFNLDRGEWYKDRTQLLDCIQNSIPPHLAYACVYWASHLITSLEGCVNLTDEVKQLLHCFATRHLLHWLEVLSITGRIDAAYSSLEMIQRVLDGRNAPILRAVQRLFIEGGRFIQRNIETLRLSGPHVYFSALPFLPHDTALFQAYDASCQWKVKVVCGIERDWSPLIAVLRGHSGTVQCISFSSNGSRFASASSDKTVQLWDGETGAHIATLEGHSAPVNSVTFSVDGSRLASASRDGTVRMWDGKTGDYIATLDGHSRFIRCVTFTPDGSRLVLASLAKTAQLRDGKTGAGVSILSGHSASVSSVVSSPDSSRIASASCDNTVRLWVSNTGAHIATLNGHSGWVHSATFSPDGSILASASWDGTIRLWDGETGTPVATLAHYLNRVRSMTFSADGSRLASMSDDRVVWLWEGKMGRRVAILEGHSASINSVTFSVDGSRLASASDDGTARLWESEAGTHIATRKGHSGRVASVTFSPDSSRLASGSFDGTVRLWDGKMGAHISTLEGCGGQAKSLIFSANGSRLSSVSRDNTIRLWDGMMDPCISTIERHSDKVHYMIFSRDGSRLGSVSADKTVRLWDSETGAHIAVLRSSLTQVNAMISSADGFTFATISDDQMMWLWDSNTGRRITLRTCSAHVDSVAFSADGSRLASKLPDETVRLWDGRTGVCVADLKGHSKHVSSMTFSRDGSRFVYASSQSVWLWDGKTGTHIATITIEHPSEVPLVAVTLLADGSRVVSVLGDDTLHLWDGRTGASVAILEARSYLVANFEANSDVFAPIEPDFVDDCRVTFSTDCSRIAVVYNNYTLRQQNVAYVCLWDAKTGALVAVLQHVGWVLSVTFSADSSRLATTSIDENVQLWDGKSGAHVLTLKGHSKSVNFVTFSPDGSLLVSVDDDGMVILWLWDCERFGPLQRFSFFNSVTFSMDGSRLALASRDTTVRLWDVVTRTDIAVLKGHSASVKCVMFLAGGSLLASVYNDGTARLWDGRTGVQVATFGGYSCQINSVAFSTDDAHLVSVAEDGTELLWDGRTGAFLGISLQKSFTNSPALVQPRHPFRLVQRTRPSLRGLIYDLISADSSDNPFCWFPPALSPCTLALHPTSPLLAVGCEEGQLLLLDVSHVYTS